MSYEFNISEDDIKRRADDLREQMAATKDDGAAATKDDGAAAADTGRDTKSLVYKYEEAMRRCQEVARSYLRINTLTPCADSDRACMKYEEVFSTRKRLALKLLDIANEHNANIAHRLVYPAIACHKKPTDKEGCHSVSSTGKVLKRKGHLQPVPGNKQLLVKTKRIRNGSRLRDFPYTYKIR